MKRRSCSPWRLVCLAVLAFGSLAGPAAAQFVASYNPPPAELQAYAAGIRETGVVEEALGEVNGALAMPRQVAVVFDACGQPNAFYNPEQGAVVFCYEFLALFDQMFSQRQLPEGELENAIVGTTVFFLLHEVGHALVHVLELPITGREEDAVDDLAALILLEAGAQEDLASAAEAFDLLATLVEASDGEPAYWDEHSLSVQRAYTMACLIYGSDPQGQADLVGPGLLPVERAGRCPAEYQQKATSWEHLLGPWLSDEAEDASFASPAEVVAGP